MIQKVFGKCEPRKVSKSLGNMWTIKGLKK